MSSAIQGFYESAKWTKEDWYWKRNTGLMEADFLPHQGGKIVYHEDTSGWAFNCLIKSYYLMIKHQRWPDFMNDDTVCNTWFARILNRTINKIFNKHLPFRYQGRMVRDSYTAIYPALILHKLDWMIKVIKPVWYVWSPGFYCWRKYLITKKPVYLKLYRLFNTPSKHEWIQRLHWLREKAIEWI